MLWINMANNDLSICNASSWLWMIDTAHFFHPICAWDIAATLVGQRWKSQRELKLTFTVEAHCLPLHILYITLVLFFVGLVVVDNSDCFIPKKPLIPGKKSDEAILRRDQPIQSVGITLWLNSCLNAITYLYSLYTSILYVSTHITSYVYLYVIHRYIHIVYIYIHIYICVM